MPKSTVFSIRFLAALFGAITLAKAGFASNSDPFKLYGPKIEFSVLRDGQAVGRHTVEFTPAPAGVRASAIFDLDIRLLFIPVYSYRYRSTAIWRDGILRQLAATTDDDGSQTEVRLREDAGQFIVTGPNGERTSAMNLFPTNHWNAGVIGADRVLNTITGEINLVRIVDKGMEEITAEGRNISARRYAYTGELETELWYDGVGRWVKMRFQGKDGSTIDYECVRCGLSRQPSTAE